jgi:hypothetical protein
MRFFTKKTSALVATASIMAMVGTATFTGPAGAAATPQASSTTLQLSNDKPGWTIGINAIGRVLASLDGGVGWQAQPYSSTTAFQGVVRAAPPPPRPRPCSHGGRASSWSRW